MVPVMVPIVALKIPEPCLVPSLPATGLSVPTLNEPFLRGQLQFHCMFPL